MKKLSILLLILCFVLCGCDILKETNRDKPTESVTEAPTEKITEAPTEKPTEVPTEMPTEEPTEIPTETPAPTEDPLAGMSEEEIIIRRRISDEYTFTVIDSVTLNPDYGTDDENDYIALVYLTWKQKNSLETSKEMLKMYSDDLAATVASDAPGIQEIAIFWTVPYLDMKAKYSYERKNNGMYITDEAWS